MDKQLHVVLYCIHIQADDFLTPDRSADHEIQLEAIMTNTQVICRTVAVVAALLLLAAASSSDRVVQAQSKSQGATLTGTWYMSVPSGLRNLYTFHKDGTVTGSSSFGFGGQPIPPMEVARSVDHGIWESVGRQFEYAVYRFNYDLVSGDVLGITRIRSVFRFDPGFESASGKFFVTQWICLTPVECPDPNVSDPAGPELAPPGNSFTMTRARLP